MWISSTEEESWVTRRMHCVERHWGVRYVNNWQEVLKSERKKVQATENCQVPSSMPKKHESRQITEVLL